MQMTIWMVIFGVLAIVIYFVDLTLLKCIEECYKNSKEHQIVALKRSASKTFTEGKLFSKEK